MIRPYSFPPQPFATKSDKSCSRIDYEALLQIYSRVVIYETEVNVHLDRAKWEIDTKTCGAATASTYKLVKEELGKAHDMALAGEQYFLTTGKLYYEAMMPKEQGVSQGGTLKSRKSLRILRVS